MKNESDNGIEKVSSNITMDATAATTRSRPLIRERVVWLAFLAGCAATLVLFAFAALLSGGGHNIVPAILLFPYSALLGFALKGFADWPGIVLLVLQYPAYCVILGLGWVRNRFKAILSLLIILHSLSAALGFLAYQHLNR